MAQLVADVLLARLREWGVRQVFGYPGDGINGLLAAWGRAKDDPQFVQARHEEMAAFEAVGFAKFSGEVGVCVATSGPGAIHLLNGLYDAKLDHVPVVAIVGQAARSAMGGSYQQEVDLLSLFKDVCSDYVQMCTGAAAVAEPDRPGDPDRPDRARPDLRDRAVGRVRPGVRTTRARVQTGPVQCRHRLGRPPPRTRTRCGPRRTCSTPGRRSRYWSGRAPGAASTSSPRSPTCSAPGAAKALLGKDVLPDTLPWVTGSIGLLGTTASYRLMMGCDTLLTVGSNFPYTQFMPDLGQARAVQIDRSGKWIGMRYPYEINLVGDAKTTLRALIPLLTRKPDRELAGTGGGRRHRLVADRRTPRADRRRPGEPDADLPRTVPAAARRTRSWSAIPAAPRTGTPGTCNSTATSAGRCPGRWRPWAPGCRTRSARNGRTRTGR